MGILFGSITSLLSIRASQLAIRRSRFGVIITTGTSYIMCRPSVAINSVRCMIAKEILSALLMEDLLVEETEGALTSSLNAQTDISSGKTQGHHDNLWGAVRRTRASNVDHSGDRGIIDLQVLLSTSSPAKYRSEAAFREWVTSQSCGSF